MFRDAGAVSANKSAIAISGSTITIASVAKFSSGDMVGVTRRTNSTWINVGQPLDSDGLSSTSPTSVSLALDANGQPVVAFEEPITNGGDIFVRRLNY